MHSLVSIEEALTRIRQAIEPLGTETVPLEAARGRILATPVIASMPQPPWDNSAMDGFALRSGDTASAPCTLRVVGTVAAGRQWDTPLAPGMAVRIFTGAPLPPGADAVIPQEEVIVEGDRLTVPRPVQVGENVRRAGEDFTPKETLLEAGTYLTAAALALAAGAGHATLTVYRRPRIWVFASGDELVPPGHPLGPGQVYESNSYYLHARLEEMGIPFAGGQTLPDRPDAVQTTLTHVLQQVDAVITTGAVSVGAYDIIRPIWVEVGVRMLVEGVRMKPGRPLLVGVTDDGRWVFGLPGNPASTFACFEVFVYPWIWWVQGFPHPLPRTVPVVLACDVDNSKGRDLLLRCRLWIQDGRWWAEPAGPQGSHLMRVTARSQCVVWIRARSRVTAGTVVPAIVPGMHPLDLVLPGVSI